MLSIVIDFDNVRMRESRQGFGFAVKTLEDFLQRLWRKGAPADDLDRHITLQTRIVALVDRRHTPLSQPLR
jgi:hypothetical protein